MDLIKRLESIFIPFATNNRVRFTRTALGITRDLFTTPQQRLRSYNKKQTCMDVQHNLYVRLPRSGRGALQLARVFDQNDAVAGLGDLRQQRVDERGLAGRGACG